MKLLPQKTALVIIDVQKAIDHPSWGRRNNPQAEENIARLLSVWRSSGRPVVHVRHFSRNPMSTYWEGGEGREFKPGFEPSNEERVITKRVHSAFIGTELEQELRREAIQTLVVTGVITNNSAEATARMAGNLGFTTYVVSDATATFDKVDLKGKLYIAEEVHELALANMDGEYATVVDTEAVLQMLAASPVHIDHLALWTPNIERLKAFYERYFQAEAGPRYTNPAKGFQSYFLSFSSGARIEIMQKASIPASRNDIDAQFTGYIHLSLSVGSKERVDALTAQLQADGFRLMDGPRQTGDGYYESSVLDPDGNRIEITV